MQLSSRFVRFPLGVKQENLQTSICMYTHVFVNASFHGSFTAEFGPSVRPECRFPSSFQGNWVLFETNRKETVTITSGEAEFSNLGHFICKSKHWALDHYKLLSVFSNGW